MNGIKVWLKRNGYNVNAGGDTAMTHTIMSGGTLYVPEDLYDEFLGMYGREIERGNTLLTYSEKRSPDVFRMYFDLDILEKCALDDKSVMDIVREVQKTAALFFTDATGDTLKCVVSRTKTKEVQVKVRVPHVPNPLNVDEADGGDAPTKEDASEDTERNAAEDEGVNDGVCEAFVKNGVHLNFPKFLVNLEIALQIRFSVVNHLDKIFGPRPIAHNPWSDVIDKAPYFNGLKMVGSVKKDQCKLCHSSKKKKAVREEKEVRRLTVLREIGKIRRKHYRRNDPNFDYTNIMNIEGDEYKNADLSKLHYEYETLATICPQCNNRGWYLEDRYYSPTHVIGAGGTLCCDDLDYIKKDFHEQMRWTSVRARPYDQITPNYSVPAGHLSPTQDTASACLSAFGSAGLEWVSPGLYREMVNSDVHAEDAKGQSRWKGSIVKDKQTMDMITTCVRQLHSSYSEIVVKEAMELKTGKQTDETTTTITSGAGAGIVVKKRAIKAGGDMLNKMAVANNTTINKNTVIRVYTSFVVRVSGQGSKFCQNKGDEHATNSVYFCISKTGICQMCHSGKDTPGLSGKVCKRYHSHAKDVPVALSRRLFAEGFGLNMDAVNAGLGKRGSVEVAVKKKLKKKTKVALKKWDVFGPS